MNNTFRVVLTGLLCLVFFGSSAQDPCDVNLIELSLTDVTGLSGQPDFDDAHVCTQGDTVRYMIATPGIECMPAAQLTLNFIDVLVPEGFTLLSSQLMGGIGGPFVEGVDYESQTVPGTGISFDFNPGMAIIIDQDNPVILDMVILPECEVIGTSASGIPCLDIKYSLPGNIPAEKSVKGSIDLLNGTFDAFLNIINSSTIPSSAIPGDTVCRTATIINNGQFSLLDSFSFCDIPDMPFDEIISFDIVLIEDGVQTLDTVDGLALLGNTTNVDSISILLDGATFGGPNSLFEVNGGVKLVYCVTTMCPPGTVISDLYAKWGCGGNVCMETSTTESVVVNFSALVDIQISKNSFEPADLCANPFMWEYEFVNNGQESTPGEADAVNAIITLDKNGCTVLDYSNFVVTYSEMGGSLMVVIGATVTQNATEILVTNLPGFWSVGDTIRVIFDAEAPPLDPVPECDRFVFPDIECLDPCPKVDYEDRCGSQFTEGFTPAQCDVQTYPFFAGAPMITLEEVSNDEPSFCTNGKVVLELENSSGVSGPLTIGQDLIFYVKKSMCNLYSTLNYEYGPTSATGTMVPAGNIDETTIDSFVVVSIPTSETLPVGSSIFFSYEIELSCNANEACYITDPECQLPDVKGSWVSCLGFRFAETYNFPYIIKDHNLPPPGAQRIMQPACRNNTYFYRYQFDGIDVSDCDMYLEYKVAQINADGTAGTVLTASQMNQNVTSSSGSIISSDVLPASIPGAPDTLRIRVTMDDPGDYFNCVPTAELAVNVQHHTQCTSAVAAVQYWKSFEVIMECGTDGSCCTKSRSCDETICHLTCGVDPMDICYDFCLRTQGISLTRQTAGCVSETDPSPGNPLPRIRGLPCDTFNFTSIGRFARIQSFPSDPSCDSVTAVRLEVTTGPFMNYCPGTADFELQIDGPDGTVLQDLCTAMDTIPYTVELFPAASPTVGTYMNRRLIFDLTDCQLPASWAQIDGDNNDRIVFSADFKVDSSVADLTCPDLFLEEKMTTRFRGESFDSDEGSTQELGCGLSRERTYYVGDPYQATVSAEIDFDPNASCQASGRVNISDICNRGNLFIDYRPGYILDSIVLDIAGGNLQYQANSGILRRKGRNGDLNYTIQAGEVSSVSTGTGSKITFTNTGAWPEELNHNNGEDSLFCLNYDLSINECYDFPGNLDVDVTVYFHGKHGCGQKSINSPGSVQLVNPPQALLECRDAPIKQVNNDSVCWQITFGSQGAAGGSWFALVPSEDVEIYRVEDEVAGVDLTMIEVDDTMWVCSNTLTAGPEYNLKLYGLYTSCDLEFVDIYAGWYCNACPLSPITGAYVGGTCPPLNKRLEVIRGETGLQAAFTGEPPSPVDLCDTLDFEIQVKNPASASNFNQEFCVYMPSEGLTLLPQFSCILYPDSVQADGNPGMYQSIPLGLQIVTVTDTIIDGQLSDKWSFDLQMLGLWNNAAMNLELPGATFPENNLNKFRIKFRAVTNCDYSSPSRVFIEARAEDRCGVPIATSAESSDLIPIMGLDPKDFNRNQITILPNELGACTGSQMITVNIESFPNQIGNNEEVCILLPPEVTYNGAFAVNPSSWNLNSPVTSTGPEGTTYCWQIPPGTPPGVLAFNIDLTIDPNVDCGPLAFTGVTLARLNAVCITGVPQAMCELSLQTSDTTTNLLQVIPQLSLDATRFSGEVICDPMGSTTQLEFCGTIAIQNDGPTIPAGEIVSATIFSDDNANGMFDMGEEVATFSYDDGIFADQVILLDSCFLINPEDICDLSVALGTGTCNCGPLPAMFPSSQITFDFCNEDNVICQGTEASLLCTNLPSGILNYSSMQDPMLQYVDMMTGTFGVNDPPPGLYTYVITYDPGAGTCSFEASCSIEVLGDVPGLSIDGPTRQCRGDTAKFTVNLPDICVRNITGSELRVELPCEVFLPESAATGVDNISEEITINGTSFPLDDAMDAVELDQVIASLNTSIQNAVPPILVCVVLASGREVEYQANIRVTNEIQNYGFQVPMGTNTVECLPSTTGAAIVETYFTDASGIEVPVPPYLCCDQDGSLYEVSSAYSIGEFAIAYPNYSGHVLGLEAKWVPEKFAELAAGLGCPDATSMQWELEIYVDGVVYPGITEVYEPNNSPTDLVDVITAGFNAINAPGVSFTTTGNNGDEQVQIAYMPGQVVGYKLCELFLPCDNPNTGFCWSFYYDQTMGKWWDCISVDPQQNYPYEGSCIDFDIVTGTSQNELLTIAQQMIIQVGSETTLPNPLNGSLQFDFTVDGGTIISIQDDCIEIRFDTAGIYEVCSTPQLTGESCMLSPVCTQIEVVADNLNTAVVVDTAQSCMEVSSMTLTFEDSLQIRRMQICDDNGNTIIDSIWSADTFFFNPNYGYGILGIEDKWTTDGLKYIASDGYGCTDVEGMTWDVKVHIDGQEYSGASDLYVPDNNPSNMVDVMVEALNDLAVPGVLFFRTGTNGSDKIAMALEMHLQYSFFGYQICENLIGCAEPADVCWNYFFDGSQFQDCIGNDPTEEFPWSNGSCFTSDFQFGFLGDNSPAPEALTYTLPPGDYTIKLTGANCGDTISYPFNLPEPPEMIITADILCTNATNCTSDDGILTYNVSTNGSIDSAIITGPTGMQTIDYAGTPVNMVTEMLTSLPVGNYSVTVFTECGDTTLMCTINSAVDMVEVTDTIIMQYSDCASNDAQIDLMISSTSTIDSVLWCGPSGLIIRDIGPHVSPYTASSGTGIVYGTWTAKIFTACSYLQEDYVIDPPTPLANVNVTCTATAPDDCNDPTGNLMVDIQYAPDMGYMPDSVVLSRSGVRLLADVSGNTMIDFGDLLPGTYIVEVFTWSVCNNQSIQCIIPEAMDAVNIASVTNPMLPCDKLFPDSITDYIINYRTIPGGLPVVQVIWYEDMVDPANVISVNTNPGQSADTLSLGVLDAGDYCAVVYAGNTSATSNCPRDTVCFTVSSEMCPPDCAFVLDVTDTTETVDCDLGSTFDITISYSTSGCVIEETIGSMDSGFQLVIRDDMGAIIETHQNIDNNLTGSFSVTNLGEGTYKAYVQYGDVSTGSFLTFCQDSIDLQFNSTNGEITYDPVIETQSTVCGVDDGEAEITSIIGSDGMMYDPADFTYMWSQGFAPLPFTGPLATGLAPGIYSVTIVDPFGCENGMEGFVITATGGEKIAPTAVIPGTNCGTCDGSIIMPDSNGIRYVLVDDSGTQYPAEPAPNDNVFNNLCAGNYTVVAFNLAMPNECPAVCDTVVPVSEDGFMVLLDTITGSPCEMSDGRISFMAINGFCNYEWELLNESGMLLSSNPSLTGNICSDGSDAGVFTGLIPGTYIVRGYVVDALTGDRLCEAEDSISLRDNEIEIMTSGLVSDGVTCNGDMDGSITINDTLKDGQMMVVETSGGMTIATFIPTDSRPYMVSGLPGGSYNIAVTGENGCVENIPFTIDEPTPVIPDPVVTPPSACGVDDAAIDVMVSGGTPDYTITWTNPTVSGFNPTGLPAGTYIYTVTDANGCMIRDTVEIRLPLCEDKCPNITAEVAVVEPNCGMSDGNAEVIVLDNPDAYTYTWSTGATSREVSGLDAGTYTVEICLIDRPECCTTKVVNVGNNGGPIAMATSTPAACGGMGIINLVINGGSLDYTIQLLDGVGMQISSTSSSVMGMQAAIPAPPGIYTIIVTDALGCQDFVQVSVDIDEGLAISTSVDQFPGCGLATGAIEITVIPGTGMYEYYVNGQLQATTSHTMYAVGGLGAGQYVVEVIDLGNAGCPGRDTIILEAAVPPVVNPSEFIVTPPSCSGDAGSISYNATMNAATYELFRLGSTVPFVSWTNTETVTIEAESGHYFVVCSDAFGCEGVVGDIVVPEVDVLDFFVHYDQPLCFDPMMGSIQIAEITGGYGLSDTVTLRILDEDDMEVDADLLVTTGLAPGTYRVEICYEGTDGASCCKTRIVTLNTPACVTHYKELVGMPALQDSGNYKVTYRVVTTNSSMATMQYNLYDSLRYDGDVVVDSLFFITPDMTIHKVQGNLDNETGMVLAIDSMIGPMEEDTFLVCVFAHIELDNTINPAATVDGTYDPCADAMSGGPGQMEYNGLFNESYLDGNDDGMVDQRDTACADLPMITHTKMLVGTPELQPDGNYKITYEIVVDNSDPLPVQYNLYDSLRYDGDVVVDSVNYITPDMVTHRLTIPLDNETGMELATDSVIAAMSQQTYRVCVFAHIELDNTINPAGTVDGTYDPCADAMSGGPGQMEYNGLFNESYLDGNDDGMIDQRDTACADLPMISHTKMLVGTPELQPDGNYKITYEIVVDNSDPLPVQYNLYDSLRYDGDVVVDSVNYITPDMMTHRLTIPLDNETGMELATDSVIDAMSQHTYRVCVFAHIELDNTINPAATVDGTYDPCTDAMSGGPGQMEYNGLFNESYLDGNDDGMVDQRDTACADLPMISHTKMLVGTPELQPDGNYKITYEIVVDNSDPLPVQYNLYDSLRYDGDVVVDSVNYITPDMVTHRLTIPLDNETGMELATDSVIDAMSQHTYRVCVFAHIELDNTINPAATVDGNYDPCTDAMSGGPGQMDYNGLFNESYLDGNDDGMIDQRDTACADLPMISHTKMLVGQDATW